MRAPAALHRLMYVPEDSIDGLILQRRLHERGVSGLRESCDLRPVQLETELDSYRMSKSPLLAGSLDATEKNPLGVPWPGAGWAEGHEPIWVNCLAFLCLNLYKKLIRPPYAPSQPAYLVASTQKRKKEPPLLVYDYAIGGDTVEQVMVQIEGAFVPRMGMKVSGVEWQSEDSLFGMFSLCLRGFVRRRYRPFCE